MPHPSTTEQRHLRSVPDTPCPVSEEQAHGLLDGELDAEQAKAVREHLGRCRDCRGKVGRLSRFLAVLHRQRAAGTRAPASLRARIHALRPPVDAVVPADESA